jgi:hypothetical protein
MDKQIIYDYINQIYLRDNIVSIFVFYPQGSSQTGSRPSLKKIPSIVIGHPSSRV